MQASRRSLRQCLSLQLLPNNVFMPPHEFVLHIWPGKWSLPSVDPSCLAAVILLQSLIPGRFAIADCLDPDSSPNGASTRLALFSLETPTKHSAARSSAIPNP